MVIIVIELLYLFNAEKIYMKNQIDDCIDYECWDDRISYFLLRGGVSEVYIDLDKNISEGKISETTCHSYAHLIGEKAFNLFIDNKDLNLSEKTSYCGYGFYHGFIEALLLSTGDYAKARDFCDYVRVHMSNKSSASYNACFHGFGHGIVDGSQAPSTRSPEVLIAEGLNVCKEIGRTDFEKDLCNSGIFNSLSIIESNPEFGIEWESDNPYWLCDKQTDPNVKKPCYEEMNTLVARYSNGYRSNAIKFIKKIPEEKYRQLAAQSYFGYYASTYPDLTIIAKQCVSLDNTLKNYCITGFVGGLLEFGSPQIEYERGLKFCDTEIFGKKEKEVCYRRVAWGARDIYPSDKASMVCNLITQKFQDVCS